MPAAESKDHRGFVVPVTPRTPERKKKRPPRTTPKHKKYAYRDDRSRNSGDSGKPSSVHLGAVPLTRDLSDLSGSYVGSRGGHQRGEGGGQGVPRDVLPPDNHTNRNWTHAKILSSREPIHPQPPADCDDSVSAMRKSTVVVEQSMGFEVVGQDDNDGSGNQRTPLLILLMDPARRNYELMQLWVDVAEDSVRDVLHAVNQNLSDKDQWKQDYDGMFQVRNNHFSQLIHILNLSKYDVQEHELWVAKPWSMSAKATVGFAAGLLNLLKGLDVLKYARVSDHARFKLSKPKNDDSVLVLTKEAKSRIYVPSGILKHHHACQFLSFSPPFEPVVRVDVLGADMDDGCSQLSDSHCGASLESGIGKFSASQSKASSMSITQLIKPRPFSPDRPRGSSSSRTPPPSTPVRSNPVNQSDGSGIFTRHTSDRKTKLTKALSMLNCGGCKHNSPPTDKIATPDRLDTTDTVMDSTFSPFWKGWDENSRAGESVVSESAPLLMRRCEVYSEPDRIAEI